MSNSNTLLRKNTSRSANPTAKTGARDRRILFTTVSGDHEIQLHATKGVRITRAR